MKIDIKSIAIIILFVLAIIFGSLWYFKGSDGSKQRINQLEQQATQLEKEKHDADLVITSLKKTQIELQATIDKQLAQITAIEKTNAILETQTNVARLNLSNAMKQLKDTQSKIDELTKNPIKRDGDDLLNSLKTNIK